jgi:hypothetical protein
MPLSEMCSWGSWDGIICSAQIDNRETLAGYFWESKKKQLGLFALSQMPASKGPLIFFDPAQICKTYSSASQGIFNQAELFHEALHGFYGKSDSTIQDAFGLAELASINITFYLQEKVFNKTASICGN